MIVSNNFLLLIIYLVTQSHAFTSQITKLWYPSCGSKLRTTVRRPVSVASSMTMRDASASYWFREGDHVRVVDDVPKAGVNLRNRVGKVVSDKMSWHYCTIVQN